MVQRDYIIIMTRRRRMLTPLLQHPRKINVASLSIHHQPVIIQHRYLCHSSSSPLHESCTSSACVILRLCVMHICIADWFFVNHHHHYMYIRPLSIHLCKCVCNPFLDIDPRHPISICMLHVHVHVRYIDQINCNQVAYICVSAHWRNPRPALLRRSEFAYISCRSLLMFT